VLRSEAYLAAAEGRWAQAQPAFARLQEEVQRHGRRWSAAWAAREWAEALLSLGEPGDREQALALLERSAAVFAATGAPCFAEETRRRVAGLAGQ
jgi:hypothetical protein